jgi:hypothetical protein
LLVSPVSATDFPLPAVEGESVELLMDWEGVFADAEDSSAAHPKMGMIAPIAIITSKTFL